MTSNDTHASIGAIRVESPKSSTTASTGQHPEFDSDNPLQHLARLSKSSEPTRRTTISDHHQSEHSLNRDTNYTNATSSINYKLRQQPTLAITNRTDTNEHHVRPTNTRGDRTSKDTRHSTSGSLHRSSNKIRALHHILHYKRKFSGDNLLTKQLKDTNILLSSESLQNVVLIAKSNSSNNTHKREGNGCIHLESTLGDQQQHLATTVDTVGEFTTFDREHKDPMIMLLWNCRGIGNQNFKINFKIHFKELLDYHKPSMVILTETKACGDEADNIMEYFNYPHSAKVDAIGNAGGIYIIWNNNVNVQLVALTQQEIYLFVKVHNFQFFTTSVYSRQYFVFKRALRKNFESFCEVYEP